MTVMSYLGAIGAAQKRGHARRRAGGDHRRGRRGQRLRHHRRRRQVRAPSRATSPEQFGRNRIRNTPISEEVIVGAAHRRGDDRAAPDRRPVVLELPVHGDGPVREPGRQEPLHVRRPGEHPGGLPLGDVLRAEHRRPPLRPAVPDVHERARAQDHHAGLPERCEGPAALGRRLRRPGADLRGLHPVGLQGGRRRERVPDPARGRADLRRAPTSPSSRSPVRCRRRSRRPTSWPRRASRSRCSTRAPWSRWTSTAIARPRPRKTGRLVVADPAHQTCGVAAEISALVSEHVFDSLRAPIRAGDHAGHADPVQPGAGKAVVPQPASDRRRGPRAARRQLRRPASDQPIVDRRPPPRRKEQRQWHESRFCSPSGAWA